MACERKRDDCGLNRSSFFEAEIPDAFHQASIETECVERYLESCRTASPPAPVLSVSSADEPVPVPHAHYDAADGGADGVDGVSELYWNSNCLLANGPGR